MNDDNEQTDLLEKEWLSLFHKFIFVYMKVKCKTEISDIPITNEFTDLARTNNLKILRQQRTQFTHMGC